MEPGRKNGRAPNSVRRARRLQEPGRLVRSIRWQLGLSYRLGFPDGRMRASLPGFFLQTLCEGWPNKWKTPDTATPVFRTVAVSRTLPHMFNCCMPMLAMDGAYLPYLQKCCI